VVDSIQTVYTENLQSAPGSVAQVRESAAQLVRFAKQSGMALFLVGHVTKRAVAGPRVLEHVDTVLYFEGDPAIRSGSSGGKTASARPTKSGIEMKEGGWSSKEPVRTLLAERPPMVSGSLRSRPLRGAGPLVEMQVLVTGSLGTPPADHN
jgi:DNA repair protein RadA/Sms